MKFDEIEYFLKASKKDFISKFYDMMVLKKISAVLIHNAFPAFEDIEPKEIINSCMEVDSRDSPFLKTFLKEPTQDLGLFDGEIIGTKLKVPENFPVNNNGYCYLFFVTFIEKYLTQKEITEAVLDLSQKQYFRDAPFTKEMLNSESPIFNFIVIPSPDEEIKNSIAYINYNQAESDTMFSAKTDMIRNIVINRDYIQ